MWRAPLDIISICFLVAIGNGRSVFFTGRKRGGGVSETTNMLCARIGVLTSSMVIGMRLVHLMRFWGFMIFRFKYTELVFLVSLLISNKLRLVTMFNNSVNCAYFSPVFRLFNESDVEGSMYFYVHWFLLYTIEFTILNKGRNKKYGKKYSTYQNMYFLPAENRLFHFYLSQISLRKLFVTPSILKKNTYLKLTKKKFWINPMHSRNFHYPYKNKTNIFRKPKQYQTYKM